ncbi:MAG: patatin-like phospholipase family protein [Pseudomonadota bacterium]
MSLTLPAALGGRAIGAALLLLVTAPPVLEATEARPETRAKIGLVLSGGGARGAAHVGVLKVLDELQIPIDFVAGTSMGAIIGGLYAAGMSIDELESVITDVDWNTFYSDRLPRADRSLRRKSDDAGFLVDFDMGIRDGALALPRGLVQGQTFEVALRRWLLPVATVRDFDRLPIPFRALATDVTTGEQVILGSGDLASAIRASMSAPGALKPVRLNGRLLVDGGLTSNVPVQVAKDMGAEHLIVVDVGFPLLDESELDSALAISNQTLTILIKRHTDRELTKLTPQDVLITPELGLLGSTAFERVAEAMELGESSARDRVEALRQLGRHVDPQRRNSALAEGRRGSPTIDRVRVDNQSLLADEVIASRLAEYRGAPLDLDQLESDIGDIFGFGTFESVNYRLSEDDSGTELLLNAREKSWGPNYLRFGINFEDDFDGTSNYNLAARLTKTEINERGGELRFEAQIGSRPRLFAELFQPLDFRSRYFVNVATEYGRDSAILFDGRRQLAQLRSRDSQFTVAGGRQFGNWGELRLGLSRVTSDGSIRIGAPDISAGEADFNSADLSFNYDTLDDNGIPRTGTLAFAQWTSSRESLGSDEAFDLGQATLLKPITWGQNTLLNWWSVSSVTKGDVAPFAVGGLFSLSGYERNEFQGKHAAVGRLLYYRRLGDARAPAFDTPVYVGASIEAGNVWQSRDDISFGSARRAGSVFVVLDTIIGPVYLAYGGAEGGRRSAYLFVGQTF